MANMSGEDVGGKRERIIVQSFTATTDAEGQAVKTWATYKTIWAQADYLTGRELEGAHKINTEIRVRFVVKYRTDLTELMRISWRSINWNIHAIIPAASKFDMELLCSAIQ